MNIWRTVMTKEFEDRGTTYSIHENVNIGEVKVLPVLLLQKLKALKALAAISLTRL